MSNIVKTWKTFKGSLSAGYDVTRKSVYFYLSENNKITEINSNCVFGIDGKAKQSHKNITRFLEHTHVEINTNSKGCYFVRIKQKVQGGGNVGDGIDIWPKGEIPCIIDVLTFPPTRRQEIVKGIQEAVAAWNSTGVVKLYSLDDPHQEIKNYLVFCETGDIKYQAHIGMKGGRQLVQCDWNGFYGENIRANVAHEIGHAIGLNNEHQRPDRYEYITVSDKVEKDFNYKLKGMGWGDYDFNSIMHYPIDGKKLAYVLYSSDDIKIPSSFPMISQGDIETVGDLYRDNIPTAIKKPGQDAKLPKQTKVTRFLQ